MSVDGAREIKGIFGDAFAKKAIDEVGGELYESNVGEYNNADNWNRPADYSKLPEPKNVGPGKNFTRKQKRNIIRENIKHNNGLLRDDETGEILDKPVQSKKGVKANMNQAEIDHNFSKKNGGSNSNTNAKVRSERNNIIKALTMELNLKKVVFTSMQVIVNSMPILYLVHDEDGDWQFLSGHETGDDKDGRIISLGTALNRDNTLRDILWITNGSKGFRKDTSSEWEIISYKDK